MFNICIHHDRNVKPVNGDESREDLCTVLLFHFINKSGFSTKDDVFKTLNLLPYQTLNEAWLAWFDVKDEKMQAQKKRNKGARNLDVKKHHFNLSQNDYHDENETYFRYARERKSLCL